MHINRKLLESSDVTKHFMTAEEQQVKRYLCQLLVDRGHRKYAERFWKLDFNIVDANKHPDFTAAVSFEEATVFLSSGFLGNGQGVLNQLDVLLRHELAHNLMMHQIRMMHVFKKRHENDKDPDEAINHLKYSASIFKLLNVIEDFEISNKRYTADDKDVVRKMTLNGEVIGGLVTEDDRGWDKMSLEQMYEELTNELIDINSAIRSNPYWSPKSKIKNGKIVYDPIDTSAAEAITMYGDIMRPSSIKAPLDIFIKSKAFKKFAEIYKQIVINIYNSLKDFTSDDDKLKLQNIIKDIASTEPQETFDVVNPNSGEAICRLYTPEGKMVATDVLKNLSGNINYDPARFSIKRKTNTKEYKDAWNSVIDKLDSKKFDDDTLNQILDIINNA